MSYEYDDNNIFAKLIRGEIPCKKVLETEHSLAFHDIAPRAPVHTLVIPKGPYVSYDHFATSASDEEIVDFVRAVGEVSRKAGVALGDGGDGYRLVSNNGRHGLQDVPHYHVHVLGGVRLGGMISVKT